MAHRRTAALSVDEESAADLVIHARRLADEAVADPLTAEAGVVDLLHRAEGLGATHALVHALRAMAAVHRARLEHVEARKLLDRAARIARRTGRTRAEAEVLGARAAVNLEVGRTDAARRDIARALARLASTRTAGAGVGDGLNAYLRLQQAVLDHNAGRLREAEVLYRRILALGDVSEDVRVRASNNLAILLVSRGAYDEALDSSERAVRAASALGPVTAAIARHTRAWVAVHQGRLTDAMVEFSEVADVYAEQGLPLGEFHIEVADAMADLRLLPEAVSAAELAVSQLAGAGVWLMHVEAQVRLARLHLERDDPRRALEVAADVIARSGLQARGAWADRARILEVQAMLSIDADGIGARDVGVARRAASRFERSGDVTAAAEAHVVAGRAAFALGRTAAGHAALQAAGRLARRGPLPLRVRGRVARATSARASGDLPRAVREARAGLKDLAAHRGTLPTMELRALASGHGAELGEIGLSILLGSGSPSRVLHWMEQTRAAALLARLPVDGDDVALGGGGVAPAVDAPSRALSTVLAGPLRDSTDRVGGGVTGAALAQPARATVGVGTLRQQLDGGVLVEFGRCEGRYVAVVVRRRTVKVVDLGLQSEVADPIRALVFALRRLADPRSPASAAAARASAEMRLEALRTLLLAPLDLSPHDELAVVPVGALHGVPWSALHAGPVTLAPSATAWSATSDASHAPRPPGTVLVAGPDLVGAQEEVDALWQVHPSARVFGAADSRRADVLPLLREAGLAHLACHGVPRADNPMFSSVVLADGPVTVQQLHRAGAAPRRLVLASCHSGADVAYAGDEVLGFVAAMLSRGTAGVVASIAAVPDVEVVDLMLGLHRRLAAGETMARALHGARGEIDRSTPAGFVNWCTFSAHGAG